MLIFPSALWLQSVSQECFHIPSWDRVECQREKLNSKKTRSIILALFCIWWLAILGHYYTVLTLLHLHIYFVLQDMWRSRSEPYNLILILSITKVFNRMFSLITLLALLMQAIIIASSNVDSTTITASSYKDSEKTTKQKVPINCQFFGLQFAFV